MKTAEEIAAEQAAARREVRAANHKAKAGNGFRCALCGSTDRVLAVDVKATGEIAAHCEGCVDRRSVEVRPLQFDERERDAVRST